jgi:hypothetical protein
MWLLRCSYQEIQTAKHAKSDAKSRKEEELCVALRTRCGLCGQLRLPDRNLSSDTDSLAPGDWVITNGVSGMVHANTLAGVWSLFKRFIIGSCHQVSVKPLDRYPDEFAFQFNNRENPYLFRDTLLRLFASSNLEYKDLTPQRKLLKERGACQPHLFSRRESLPEILKVDALLNIAPCFWQRLLAQPVL